MLFIFFNILNILYKYTYRTYLLARANESRTNKINIPKNKYNISSSVI